MSFWLAVALQSADAPAPIGLAKLSRPILPVAPRCGGEASGDEIVICRRNPDRYRLPLPGERAPPERAKGEAQGGLSALAGPSRCGIFAGERRCDKREAARYGYGKGRDPITVLSRLAGKAIDPEGD
jgi:hypothetical protein